MDFNFGFSYVGLIFFIMFVIPDTILKRKKLNDYNKNTNNVNRLLVYFERIGETLVIYISLLSKNFNINNISYWTIILLVSFIIMVFYEIYWIRYFKSEKTVNDYYGSFLGIPVAGATLPVLAFLLLGVYGKSIYLIFSVIILGVGRIGIYLCHKREIEQNI